MNSRPFCLHSLVREVLLAVLLSCIFFLPTLSALAQVTEAELDALIEQARTKWQVPGMAVAIVSGDSAIFMKGYGVRERGRAEPVNKETLFGIGSNTKAFTSAALAILVDDKKLSWSDQPSDHLPYFRLGDPCASESVIIRDIASHRTGLSRHDELWDYTDWTREEVIRAVGELPLDKSFREQYQYQNIMFIAAGEIVGRASGGSWEIFVQRRILDPLRMKDTRLSILDARNSANHAVGHRRDSDTDEIEPFPWNDDRTVGPAGSIHSSARDMSSWLRMQLADGMFEGKRIVSSESLTETKTPQTIMRVEGSTAEFHPQTKTMSYGMGWNLQDYNGERVATHTGALNGFRASVTLLPDRHVGFAILSNVSPYAPLHAIRNTLIDKFTGHPGRNWIEYYAAAQRKLEAEEKQEKEEREASRQSGTRPSREASHFAGSYEATGYGTAEVAVDGNGQLTFAWGRLRVPLEHFHFDTFVIRDEREGIDELLTFSLGPKGEVKSLSVFGQTFSRREGEK